MKHVHVAICLDVADDSVADEYAKFFNNNFSSALTDLFGQETETELKIKDWNCHARVSDLPFDTKGIIFISKESESKIQARLVAALGEDNYKEFLKAKASIERYRLKKKKKKTS